MLTTKEIFLIAALLCLIMFLVLYSFRRYQVRGIDELLLANVLGMGANMLYGFGRQLPPLIAYEAADAFYAAASAAALIGYRRLCGRRQGVIMVWAAVVLSTALVAVFHYWIDSYAGRTLAVSAFQVGVALDIAYSVLRSRNEWSSSRYPVLFVLSMCAADAAGHGSRALVHLYLASAPQSLLEPSGWNVFYLSAGAVMLPVLTLGGLLLVHRRVLLLAERAANRDFLTGAWSRRAFFEMAEREILRARRNALPLAVLLIDLDEMKSVNDALGHAAGDDMLIGFVHEAQRRLRGVDMLARLGGDEFAVLMPETGAEGALKVAGRLQPPQRGGAGTKFSAGIAALRSDDTLQALLARADAALYQAKALGRNRIVVEPAPDTPVKAEARPDPQHPAH